MTSMAFSPAFDTALIVAALAHRRQLRKGTRIPYVMHPFHVSTLLARFGYGEHLMIAGLLHDVLEDVPFDDARLQADFAATFAQWQWPDRMDAAAFRDSLRAFLRATFGDEVVALVMAVTEEKNEGGPEKPWIERKQQQLAHLEACSAGEAALKAADALHNVSSMVEDIRSGRATLGERFKATPDQTLWYYGEVTRLVRARTDDAPIAAALHRALYELTGLVNSA